MTKEQFERKSRYRELWGRNLFGGKPHGLSYPMWLECELASQETIRSELVSRVSEYERRFEAFSQYIEDMERGMRIVERCAGTFDVKTVIPSLKYEDCGEAVRASIVWLYRTVSDAKRRFLDGASK